MYKSSLNIILKIENFSMKIYVFIVVNQKWLQEPSLIFRELIYQIDKQ